MYKVINLETNEVVFENATDPHKYAREYASENKVDVGVVLETEHGIETTTYQGSDKTSLERLKEIKEAVYGKPESTSRVARDDDTDVLDLL